jgi:hypothetical protein
MDQRLTIKMLDLIEDLTVQNAALKALLLQSVRNMDMAKLDSLVQRFADDLAARDKVRQLWLPLRKRLESDSGLEEAVKQFLQIVPPTKDVH